MSVQARDDFLEKLLYGQEAEIKVAKWLMKLGYYVVPRYLPNADEGAPSMFGVNGQYALPDLDVFGGKKRFWFEVKRKKMYCWRGCWQTGFAPRNREHYLKVQEESGNEVFVGFYDELKGELYGNFLNALEQERFEQGQRFPRFWDGRVGGQRRDKPIVFYPVSAMVLLAKLDEL